MIKRKDDTWTTIQCPNCNDCYKVLNNKAHWQQSCPYCSNLIELQEFKPEGEAAATSPILDPVEELKAADGKIHPDLFAAKCVNSVLAEREK